MSYIFRKCKFGSNVYMTPVLRTSSTKAALRARSAAEARQSTCGSTPHSEGVASGAPCGEQPRCGYAASNAPRVGVGVGVEVWVEVGVGVGVGIGVGVGLG